MGTGNSTFGDTASLLSISPDFPRYPFNVALAASQGLILDQVLPGAFPRQQLVCSARLLDCLQCEGLMKRKVFIDDRFCGEPNIRIYYQWKSSFRNIWDESLRRQVAKLAEQLLKKGVFPEWKACNVGSQRGRLKYFLRVQEMGSKQRRGWQVIQQQFRQRTQLGEAKLRWQLFRG